MDKHVRHIVEDLLPLYEEGLLSNETTKWVEEQIEENGELQKLAQRLQNPLEKEEVPNTSEGSRDKMFKKINRRLSLYQIIFVALSFLLAIQTSLLNDSFGFILWYTVLGIVSYLFYSDMKMVFLLSFIPIFIWSVVDGISDYLAGHIAMDASLFMYGFDVLQMAIFVSVIHYLFALVGSVIGLLIKKLRRSTYE
ncbi:hypothetical protein ACFSTA_00055 [Ornithinibacillus salinisoli]|uniref:DUF1700 domain-containing protein n=1 Tax=Ornithinibacillus salinisoli TaxID=1848459 RepID=A0ABW4VT28_9BACI